jgi:type I restriction enzyme S subunit
MAMIGQMIFKKHSSYKDSGLNWVSKLPAHWEIVRSKRLFRQRKEKRRDSDIQLTASQKHGIIPQDIFMELEGRKVTQVEFNSGILKHVEVNDFVISMRSFQGGLEYSTYSGCMSSAYIALSPIKHVIPEFYKYLFKCDSYIKALSSTSNLVRDGQAMRFDNFSQIDLYIVPKIEQTAIANFLDEKTAKIDLAIAQKERLIELLQERKQIIIQQAVTKGLDPTVEMKDSGVEWIGEIPKHWEVKRLKFLGDAVIGLTYSPNDLCGKEKGTLVLRSSNLHEGKFRYGEKENVYVKTRISEKLTLLENDILICSRNGSRDLIGKCAIASNKDAGVSFGAFTTVFRSRINYYLFNILNSEIFRYLSGMFLTSTINQLTIKNLNSISVPIPPEKERLLINKYIKTKITQIDNSINLEKQQIAKLKEYKATLIDSAVTGKIKVG